MRKKPRKQRIRQIQNKVRRDKYVISNKITHSKTVEGILEEIRR